MKRLIVCCDGTWQRITQDVPTNVAKLAFAISGVDDEDPEKDVPQIVYYDSGVGTPFEQTDRSWFRRMLSGIKRKRQGAFGGGLEEKIYDAYRFLALNYREGDQIWLFGFSRGAYTARSLAGMIYNSGLVHRRNVGEIARAYELYRSDLHPDSWECRDFRERMGFEPDIHFLGCWDTVGMRGVPDLSDDIDLNEKLNSDYRFHDTKLNPKIIHARHACAADEERKAFPLTDMTEHEDRDDQLKQVWFAGPHGGVGGGETKNEPLSDIPMMWMASEARACGLALEYAWLESRLRPGPLEDYKIPGGLLSAIGPNVRSGPPAPTGQAQPDLSPLHPALRLRLLKRDDYDPDSLPGWKAWVQAHSDQAV